jgi:serine/threonine protein phosphatase 1
MIMRTYAIGDIHGQLDMLKAAHAHIEADKIRVGDPDAQIIHLGDYVDRGPDSKGVIDYLMDGMANGKPWQAIMGNHDQMFCYFVRDGIAHDDEIKADLSWLNPRLGGDTTLASYGVTSVDGEFEAGMLASQKAVPEEHLQFLENLPLKIQVGNYVFVHAGVRPGVPLEEQTRNDMIWIRDGWLDYTGELPYMVVHGHTAIENPTHFGNRIDIDTGAGRGRYLTAIVVEDDEQFVITATGREALTKADPA